MLESIRLQRFRGFVDEELAVRPLTVLFGPNSAGKSSFGQALVALQQASYWPFAIPSLERPKGAASHAWTVDLGTLESLRSHGQAGDVGIILGVRDRERSGRVELGFGGQGSNGLELSRFAVRESDGSVTTKRLSFERIDQTLWRNDDNEEGVVRFSRFEEFTFTKVTGTMASVLTPELKTLARTLEGLRYIRPNRCDPKRSVSIFSDQERTAVDWVGAAGEWTPHVAHDLRERPIEFPRVPAPPPERKDEALLSLDLPMMTRTATFSELLQEWVRHLGLAEDLIVTENGPALSMKAKIHDKGPPLDLVDVGFGLSQVVPVLVQGLAMQTGSTLVAEQPDSQLHPAPQARLADFFCALVKSGRNAIVESHSEAFFHRLRVRAALDADLCNKISVVFVPQCSGTGCGPIKQVPLDQEHELQWPSGFLEDGLSEQIRLTAAFAARRMKK